MGSNPTPAPDWPHALPRRPAFVEPPAALVAFAAFEFAEALLPLGLGFAAGAMLYVVICRCMTCGWLRPRFTRSLVWP